MKKVEELTPIPSNWSALHEIHYGDVAKHGEGKGGFDSGWVLLDDYSLTISSQVGHQESTFKDCRCGRTSKRRQPRLKSHLVMFCPFTGLPLYEESQRPPALTPKQAVRRSHDAAVQASLF